MKKLFTLLLVALMILSLASCGEKEKNENFSGTWKVESIEYEGSKFSVEEWNNMEDEDFSGFYIIFKDGGKAYVYDDGYGDLLNWLKSDDSIMIGDEKCSIIDEMICLDYYGDKIYLKKTSDSQEIPKENDVEEDSSIETSSSEAENDSTNDDEEDSLVETTSSEIEKDSTGDDAEWKQFLKDYEAWVDDYIAIVKKYNDNPTDMSILSDYSEMISEMTDWTERADEIELELEDTDAALEYSAELLRIAGKLAEAAY